MTLEETKDKILLEIQEFLAKAKLEQNEEIGKTLRTDINNLIYPKGETEP